MDRALTGLQSGLPEGLEEGTPYGPATGPELRAGALAATARVCIEELRRAGAEPLVEARDHDLADLLQEGPAPLATARGFEVGGRLASALGALPRRQAVLLALRHQADLGYADLAELLGVDRREVGILLHRARRALRAALSKGAA